MNKLIIIFPFFALACSGQKQQQNFSSFDKATRILIDYSSDQLRDTSVLIYPTLLNMFSEVFNNKEEKCSCSISGKIVFYSGDSILTTIPFSTNPPECVFLIISEGGNKECYRLTYRLGMYLGEYMIKKKQHD